jgi:hypothetical protein|tara:strand:+ start:135 stop:572 length:438 start_codon:yes stop_codon:yes gene_type:complete
VFHFDPITPYRVRDKHTYYASGISDAIDKGGSDCMTEDVMRAIYNGKVYLYDIISEEGDDLFGFIVMQEYTDCYSEKSVLHVDYAYLSQQSSGLMRLYQSLPLFAAAKGFDQIVFSSNRKGWEKYRKITGFNGETRVFYKDLQHG